MSRLMKKDLALAALALVGLLVFLGCRIFSTTVNVRLAARPDHVTLCYDSPQFSSEALVTLRTQEASKRLTGWTQRSGAVVKSAYRERVVDTLLFDGSCLDALGVLPEVGVPLSDIDAEGCLLDRETAYALFGSEQVLGLSVSLEGKHYTIRGLLSSATPLVVAAQRDQQAPMAPKFDRLTIALSEMDNPTEAAAGFLQRTSAPPPDFTVSSRFYRAIALVLENMVCMLSALLLLFMLARLLPYKWRRWWVLLLFGLMLLWLLGFRIELFPEQFPSRWSDFAFWERGLERARTGWRTLFTMQKLGPDEVPLNNLRSLAQTSVMALAALTVAACSVRALLKRDGG